MGITPDDMPANRPDRFKDRFLAIVDEWRAGCIRCGEQQVFASLPGSRGQLHLPLCARHVRWAMAARDERVGKQARTLQKLLLAWCRLRGDDSAIAHLWLAGNLEP